MDTPLGCTVGNALEVWEAAEVLRERGPKDLIDCCLELTEGLLALASGRGGAAYPKAAAKLADGSAYRKFLEMIGAQGGDVSVLDRGFPPAPFVREMRSDRSGRLERLDAEAVGLAAGLLGAGRHVKGDPVDHAAGIVLHKKPGDPVTAGECVCELHTSVESLFQEAEELLKGHIHIV
jgi:thymidine phosphorylase